MKDDDLSLRENADPPSLATGPAAPLMEEEGRKRKSETGSREQAKGGRGEAGDFTFQMTLRCCGWTPLCDRIHSKLRNVRATRGAISAAEFRVE